VRNSVSPLRIAKDAKALVHPYSTYPLTDCGNAERLIDQHSGCLRFCRASHQWFIWTGYRWIGDRDAAVQLAKKTVRAMQQERKQIAGQSDRNPGDWELLRRRADALGKWATHSEGAAQIGAMLRMAESDPRLSVVPADFDRNPWLLCVQNGSIDLDSGGFREHRPEELLTKFAGATYQADAQCPRWERFLDEVFEPHPEVIPFLRRAIGYTLTGDTREECVFVLVGSGRNGKSTLIGLLHGLFGDYGGVAEMDTFLASRGNALREDIADMRGRRFVSSQEPTINSAFAEATLKWVSGGDRIRARRLYEHAQEFQPTHKLWLAVNRVPTLRANDSAAWSRLRVIPFDVSFAGRINRELKVELNSELTGILRWAVKGCLLWQRDGLGSTPSVEDATEMWRKRGNKAS
jgi:putative DNA primase/helicase